MKILLRVVVSLGVLALLFLLLPWPQFRDALARFSPFIWLGVLSGFLAGHGLGIVKWRLLVNAGHRSLGARDALRCYGAGLFANLCLPTLIGGDVLRAAMASKATGRPEAVILGGIADRGIDVAVLGLLVVVGALLSRGAVGGEWAAVLATLGVGAGTAAGALAFAVRRPLRSWPRRLQRPIGRGLVALRRLRRRPQAAATACGLALILQGGFVLLNAWIGRSIGIAVPLALWFFVWPLAKLSGLLPISLGGLGVRDAVLGGLLVPAGVPMATGVVASLIWQTILIAGGLLAGATWLLLDRRTRRLRGAEKPDCKEGEAALVRSAIPSD